MKRVYPPLLRHSRATTLWRASDADRAEAKVLGHATPGDTSGVGGVEPGEAAGAVSAGTVAVRWGAWSGSGPARTPETGLPCLPRQPPCRRQSAPSDSTRSAPRYPICRNSSAVSSSALKETFCEEVPLGVFNPDPRLIHGNGHRHGRCPRGRCEGPSPWSAVLLRSDSVHEYPCNCARCQGCASDLSAP